MSHGANETSDAFSTPAEFGYYPEAEVYPGSGQELEHKQKPDDWLMDTRYIPLDMDLMSQLFRRYDKDSNIRTVCHIFYSTLFAGGVLFERKDAKLNQAAARWYDATWASWAEEVDRNQSSVGFAACSFTPHNEYVGVPTCIDLTTCMVLYRKDVFNRPHFVFFECLTGFNNPMGFLAARNSMKGVTGVFGSMYRYIPNVVVYYETEPTSAGEIRSRVEVLAPDLDLDETLVVSTKMATISRSNPPLVLESVREPHDPEAIISTVQPLSMMLGDGYGPTGSSSSSSSSSMTRAQEEQMERQKYQYAQMLSMMGRTGAEKAEALARQHMRMIAAQGLREHYLGEGRKYVNHHLAESPDALLIQFRAARMERVFQIFGIPIGMVSQQSSLGGKTNMNENAMMVFMNTQKQKKQQLLNYMYDMYNRIYLVHHTLHVLANTPKGELPQRKTEIPDTGINIIMTGLPLDEVVKELYIMGALRYEAFVKYMSSKHAIPEEDFNSSCEMSLDDLNGIKPEPAGPAKPKAKKKK
jgi:hypothetical protein